MNDIQKNRMKQIRRESRENYLEALLMLQRKRDEVRSSDLASFMGFSRASVSQAILAMERDGFVSVDEKYCLHMTDAGRNIAEKTQRKHSFFEKNLLRAGVDPVTAQEEGSRLGHAISDDSFEKIAGSGMCKEEEI
ncbi:MAG: metal-dependent transcriptional regulator [Clostridiales bacterium]|nr:metal-dependent transcriptional regulator [Clostridiales bacterium]MCD8132846.1 metal-dependent transcriptional regulator [Clostridiales bacterium]